MKKGLTYISERTSQLRYADDAGKEQWVQQTSTYIPLVEIKRGQPVSIATIVDLEIIAGDNTALFEALKNSSDTYVVLTNPSRHVSTVGLALEYTDGQFTFEDGELKTSEKIHIIGQGLYVEDKDYVAQAFTEQDEVDVSAYEYWPEFFDDYENSIGKKIYVKGSCDGELTLVKEEAYLAYNQVIVVGFVSDANIKNGENTMNVGAIEVQMMGDDRGAVDATQFEAIIGEDVYIGRNKVQVNGETNCATKVFALGCDDDETFKFSFNFFENQNKILPRGFIAIQRMDGATAYVCVNGEFTEDDVINNEGWTASDRAFVQVARYWALASESTNKFFGIKDFDVTRKVVAPANLDTFINEAFAAVSAGEIKSLKDGQIHNANQLTQLSTQKGVYRYVANDVGGTYDVYISSNLRDYVNALYIDSHGANYNKGYAVLADIRNKNRQNIIGVYASGHTGLITQGTRAIFLKQGLFTDSTKPYEVGATYYLGSHGDIFLVPQEFYNSIVTVGFAQTDSELIVDCCDSRQYNNGDLPVGYMKPTIKGDPEFGFWAMDGKTPHKTSDAEHLLTFLKGVYDEGELQIKSYNFGTAEEPDYAEGFIIPSVQYHSHYSDENTTGYVAGQIKWLASAVYKEMPRTPFVRRTATIQKFVKDGKEYDRAVLPDIDITSIMIYGPDEDRMQVPDLETLDIKLFVDLDKTGTSRNWTQLEPGFHTSNNFTYYGFKWTVVQTKEVDASHPYGEYALRAVYSGTETEDTEDVDTSVLGICMQADPYAPPVSLAGYDVKVFVTKHDYYSRQFDVESLFKDYVKESVVDVSGNPWQNNAVSGKAVRDDIKYKVDTDRLVVSDEDKMAGTVDAFVKHIYLTSEKGNFAEAQERNKYFNERLIKTDLRLQNPNGTDIWNIDYVNGLLEFANNDNTNDTTADISLESKVRNSRYSLMPYFLYKKHEDAAVGDKAFLDDKDASDKLEYPHGIKNTGFSGTLNAYQLQGANLGYGAYIFSQNADDTIQNEDSGTRATGSAITIPYIQKFGTTEPRYIMRIGNVLKQYHGANLLSTEELNFDGANNVLSRKATRTGALSKYTENKFGITVEYDYDKDVVGFLKGDSGDNYVDLKFKQFIQASSIKYKYLLHSFANENADTTFIDMFSAKDKREEFTEPMNEALQAIYEMPLATFKYNRDYESGNDYYKRFFGIIVEQTANTSKKFAEAEDIGNKTTVDDLAYVYTKAEAASIAEYLKLVTDNTESGMNTNNVVGMLLKAAKETQERLLNLEVAAYGKDAPTLPGSDTVNTKYSENQKSTVAGLNRLVKALCREVFQDADPESINDKGAWSPDGENYSRLDMLDKEVNGEAAKDDEGKSNRIALAEVSTYPDDASITQAVTIERAPVADEDKNNDFQDAQEYIDDVTYTEVDSSSDEFDGLNDAVNRIVAKLNQLTTDVKGSDAIKNRPLKLDYIRQTLETILREVYDDEDATAESLEDGAYKKTAVSRIDRIIEELYNFDLTVGAERLGSTASTFNGKYLKGSKIGEEQDTTTYAEFASESPESLAELKDKASIVDVIIQLLTGNEKELVRKDARLFSDRNVTENGYKVKTQEPDTDVYGVTYDPDEGHLESNTVFFNHGTIIERLDAIEKALELISLKVQNKLNFTDLATRNNASPYERVTSIDDFFNHIAALFNITFEKDGFYNTKRDATVYAESIRNISNGPSSKKDTLDLYNIIYDIVKRTKNNEWALKYNEVVLGSDYDDYLDSTKTKASYESLDIDTPEHKKDYTVTSDMQAILKLLWGKDIAEEKNTSNNTAYAHFNVEAAKADNFTKSPNEGVSVLDELYKMLYNVPAINNASGTKIINKDYDDFTQYNTLWFDPAAPKGTLACTDEVNDSLLGRGHRSKFIAQSGTDAPLNRIDILEKVVQALYKYLGMGSKANANYYNGTFTFAPNKTAVPSELWGSNETVTDKTNNGYEVLINGADYDVHDRYHEVAANGNYHLSAIALQAYYNSVDIADLLTNKVNGVRTAARYTKAARGSISATTEHQKVESDKTSVAIDSYLTAHDSYSIFASIQKALTYADKLDEGLMLLKKEFYEEKYVVDFNIEKLWAVLGTDYSTTSTKSTVTERITALEGSVGKKNDAAADNGTLWAKANNNKNLIDGLRTELGDSSDKTDKTVYSRLKTLEAGVEAVTKSVKDVDVTETSTSAVNNDIVFNKVSLKNKTEDKDDADEHVLATKASVAALVEASISELQTEMKTAIQNNRKLAALMAYMKCDDIKASASAVQFVRSGSERSDGGYDMQEKNCTFKSGDATATGKITIGKDGKTEVKFCGESMIYLTLEDYVDHLKFECYVPYDSGITGTATYENQTFKYGSGNNSSSLDDDTVIIKVY